ncbi:MAG: FAD-dependent oxidoreductase [Deltaproteobacteria bacterium]|nr:FAD-dependent oxidoreductase [Deltaproteobacteria bacterium]
MSIFSSTRREILTSLLGLPLLAACPRKTTSLDVDGGYVDDLQTDGHRIRDGAFTSESPDAAPSGSLSVLVLGGGVAGLAAARRLVKAGLKSVRVIEAGEEPGGTARSGTSPVTRYPWGAHYLPVPDISNSALVEFLSEIGALESTSTRTSTLDPRDAVIAREDVLCRDPEERVFAGGRWHRGLFPEAVASSADLAALRRFEARVDAFVDPRGIGRRGARAFSIPVAHSADDAVAAELDEISMGAWLAREGFESPRLRWYVEYACRDDFGASLGDTSAWYGLHYFAARRGQPKGTSAPLMTWPEGNGFLVDQLISGVGVEKIETNTLVTEIRPRGDGRRTEVRTWNRTNHRAECLTADHVIFALPSFLRRHLLRGFDPEPVDYAPMTSPWLVANIFLRARPRSVGFEPAWDNVMFDSASLGYVVATHQRGRDFGPTVWTYYLPLVQSDARASRQQLASLAWSDAARAVLDDLDRAHIGLRRCVERIDIVRWGHGMVRPTVGTWRARDRRRAQEPVGAVHFAHTDLSGVALFEEAFYHGLRAADEVIARSRTG